MTSQEFQYLLNQRHREELLVIPKKTVGLALSAVALFCLGFGFEIGGFIANSPYSLWGLGIGGACGLLLGRWSNRHTDQLVEKYRDQKGPKEPS